MPDFESDSDHIRYSDTRARRGEVAASAGGSGEATGESAGRLGAGWLDSRAIKAAAAVVGAVCAGAFAVALWRGSPPEDTGARGTGARSETELRSRGLTAPPPPDISRVELLARDAALRRELARLRDELERLERALSGARRGENGGGVAPSEASGWGGAGEAAGAPKSPRCRTPPVP